MGFYDESFESLAAHMLRRARGEPLLHRPGPNAITPGLAPGGLVFHVYDMEDRLLAEERVLAPGCEPSEETLEVARASGAVCLVVFDGDTGLRWSPEDFEAIGLRSGEQL